VGQKKVGDSCIWTLHGKKKKGTGKRQRLTQDTREKKVFGTMETGTEHYKFEEKPKMELERKGRRGGDFTAPTSFLKTGGERETPSRTQCRTLFRFICPIQSW